MAILLFAELVAGGIADTAAAPDDELLEFLGGWSTEELVWLEDMLREEEHVDAKGSAQGESEND